MSSNSGSSLTPYSYRLSLTLLFIVTLFATPAAFAETPLTTPGSPAGSYTLSDFEKLNLFNGRLNFTLPLGLSGGRGKINNMMMLRVDQFYWVTDYTPDNNEFGLPSMAYARNDEYGGFKGTFGVGSVSGDTKHDVRCAPGSGFNFATALYRIFFSAPDGTRFEFRTEFNNGRPYQIACSSTGISIGTNLISGDGTAATFVSDVPLRYIPLGSDAVSIRPSGFVKLADGTHYRVDAGRISYIRDSNGNKTSFTYDDGYSYNPAILGYNPRVTSITDSLNRRITICYGGTAECPDAPYDQISYYGFAASPRTVKIRYASLNDILRPGLTSPAILFPELHGGSEEYNPIKVSAIELPDGRSYKLYYNPYGELARVELPTGGAYEYDHTSGSGVMMSDPFYQKIYRRLIKRRVYPDGGTGDTYERETVYEDTFDTAAPPYATIVTKKDYTSPLSAQGRQLTSSEKHYYYGDVRRSYVGQWYSPWKESREYQTDQLDVTTGNALQTVQYEWVQRAPVSWWAAPYCHAERCHPDYAPVNDPRVDSITTLVKDVSPHLVSKKAFIYDAFNNPTDVYEYDYGQGAAPAYPKRHTHTNYLTINPKNGIDYSGMAVHIRRLPQDVQIYEVNDQTGIQATQPVSKSEVFYDEQSYLLPNYSHTPVGWDPPATSARGNVTTNRRWLNTSDSWLETNSAYDQVGNVRKTWDARVNRPEAERLTQISYEDSFTPTAACTLPDGSPCYTYAFPTQVTSPVPKVSDERVMDTSLVSSKVYDYWSGMPTSSTDANGNTTTLQYKTDAGATDPLDRLLKVVFPNGGWVKYSYNDANHNLYISSTTKLDDNRDVEARQYFDGFGRETRKFQFNGVAPAPWTVVDTYFDQMGRAAEVSNPYRVASPAAARPAACNACTKTTYDELGRMRSITSPDAAVTVTNYSGNTATVTEQNNLQRRSEKDAFGRLIKIVEAPNKTAYNLSTTYSYDGMNNLSTVSQSGQTRTFIFDSLARPILARNPEQAATLVDSRAAGLWSLSYAYDANGNIEEKRDSRGVTTSYAYDGMNRLLSRSYAVAGTPPDNYEATPAVSLYYDGKGMPLDEQGTQIPAPLDSSGYLTAVKSSASQVVYTEFDNMGKVMKHRQITNGQPHFLMSYDYNLAGNLIRQQYPSGRSVVTEYDNAGRVAGVRKEGSSYYGGAAPGEADSIKYTAHGALASLKLGNNKWQTFEYNNRLQVKHIGLGNSDADSSLLKLEYTYGALNNNVLDPTRNNGNVRAQKITAAGITLEQTYEYDDLNRLKLAAEKDAVAETWKQGFLYPDAFGNRRIDAANTTTAYTENPEFNAATNRISTAGYNYDLAGNLILRPGYTYGYDAENRVARVNNGQQFGISTYHYDGDGRRIMKVTGSGASVTVFVYDVLGKLVAEYTSAAPSLAGTSYITSDQYGSLRLITTAGGAVKARHDYMPFGEELAASTGGRINIPGYGNSDGMKQKFAGKERDDEAKLDYVKARYLAFDLGRFVSVDPVVTPADMVNPQTWNRYTYAINNPLAYVDHDGRWPTGIHNRIIDEALPGLSGNERDSIKSGSFNTDVPGTMFERNANQHAMRRTDQTVEQARAGYEQHVNNNLNEARRLYELNPMAARASLYRFGVATHATLDNTSPAHTPFQLYRGMMEYSMMTDWLRDIIIHDHIESDITPEQFEASVGELRKAFRATYPEKMYQRAIGNLGSWSRWGMAPASNPGRSPRTRDFGTVTIIVPRNHPLARVLEYKDPTRR
jgi:RHS repeat-associated protein